MWWTTLSSPSWWLQPSLWSSTSRIQNPPKKRLSLYIARQVLLFWLVVLWLTLCLSLAAIILPAIFLVMTQRQPSKEKKETTKFLNLTKLLMTNTSRKKKEKEAAWLDCNTARKKRTAQTTLHQHQLCLQALQSNVPRAATYAPQRTKVLRLLPTQLSLKTTRVHYCWPQRSSIG